MFTTVIVSLRELSRVSVRCQHCGTVVIIDLSSDERMVKKYPNMDPIAEECPTCYKKYDSALKMGLRNIQNAYDSLQPIAGYIDFHISSDEKLQPVTPSPA